MERPVHNMSNLFAQLGQPNDDAAIARFIPALIARELLIRTSDLQRGKWMFALIVFACLGISAIYEIIEWIAGATSGEGAEAFLGTQGDVWDTQKDMALAGVGAVLGLLTLSGLHDRFLRKIGK